MPTRRFEQAQLLVGGWAVVFCLIEFAQAQPGYVPPPTPLPPPVLNPSNPGTVPQPSYRSITPSTRSTVPLSEVTPPANEEPSTRTVHHHHHRGRYIVIGPSLGSYSCGYLGCVRLYPWAFPCQYYSRYCLPYGYMASAVWSPGYYDYAPGQLGR